MKSKIARRSGVLLHPSSFPGDWGIGDLGAAARSFIDFLGHTHQQIWQVLPLGPTGDDGAPYSSFSSNAGNPLLISVEDLVADGVDIVATPPGKKVSSAIDLGAVKAVKFEVLKRAAIAFRTNAPLVKEFERFCSEQSDWLDDYALFMALKDSHPGKKWNQWPQALVKREKSALERVKIELSESIEFHKFLQFVFFRQWSGLREYAHDRGIRIVGDIPFYVAFDSVDVWANPLNFALLPDTYEPKLMAGVPPDYFSETGQLWGNPVYDWKHLESTGFDWWIKRFQRLTKLVDVIRIDHFRGFQAYWQVPHGETTAINGSWMKCPGDAFFHTLEHALGHLPVWAEDLGLVTPQVERLRDTFDFPGMKVLQFAFDDKGAENPYLPFNYDSNFVCYTGTHDNDTVVGWWNTLNKQQQQLALEYTGPVLAQDIHWTMVRLAMSSIAGTVVTPLQDLLGLGTEARMNVPGRATGNWSWRYEPSAITKELAHKLKATTTTYGRGRLHKPKKS
jgi:4-alpha-glucanotransferase